MAFEHTTVLLHETVDGLNVRPDGIYVDATLGGGGHAFEVCRRLGSTGRLIGIDQDADAIKAAGQRLEGFGEKVTVIRSNYRDMKPELHKLGIDSVDGITLDLGVSSYQLDTADRGFSYRMDAPLDMRMDQRQKMTARDIVNEYSEVELFRVIRDYGEDRFAKNIAKHIVAEREKAPIETTGQLNYDGAGMYTRSDSWFSSYNNTFKDTDTNYEADWNQMQSIVINGQGIHNIGKYYWLASRRVNASDRVSNFLVRLVYPDGYPYDNDLCVVSSYGVRQRVWA